MATQNQKKNTIDKLNDAFINKAVNNTKRDFELFFDKTIVDSLNDLPEKPTSKDIRKIINKIPIKRTAMLRQTYNMTALSAINNVIQNVKLSPADAKLIKPILHIIARYSVNNPALLAKKVDQLTAASITGNTAGISDKDKSLFKSLDKFYEVNRSFIAQELQENKVNLTKIHREIKTNISRTILKDLKREIRTRVNVVVETNGKTEIVKRPQTYAEVRKKLRAKFGDELDYRVRRIVDTEMHDLSEKTEASHNLLMGYTHKTWNNQQDARVRQPKPGNKNRANHVVMQGVTVPIKSLFNVAGGGKGMYPGDPQLPAGQRINCRCFLTYSRR